MPSADVGTLVFFLFFSIDYDLWVCISAAVLASHVLNMEFEIREKNYTER